MKKLSIFCFMAILAAFGLSSCGGAGTQAQDKAIADKIENGEELTSEDYTHMINYVGEFARKAEPYVTANGEAASQDLTALKEEYPFLDTFRECLKITPVDKLSENNLEEVGKYAGLIEFTAPMGYVLNTNTEAAGIEVGVPDSANGVVAGAVDTVSVKN